MARSKKKNEAKARAKGKGGRGGEKGGKGGRGAHSGGAIAKADTVAEVYIQSLPAPFFSAGSASELISSFLLPSCVLNMLI